MGSADPQYCDMYTVPATSRSSGVTMGSADPQYCDFSLNCGNARIHNVTIGSADPQYCDLEDCLKKCNVKK
jgi:hypothetical protein